MKRQEIILSGEPQRKALLRFVESVNIDQPLRVTIEENKRRRSLGQLALYWMWLHDVADKVADYTGYTAEDIHEFLKQKYLRPIVVEIGDDVVQRYTTTKLTTAEMHDFVDKVYMWATSELGLLLPLPEERLAR